jgi:hypothetical protein
MLLLLLLLFVMQLFVLLVLSKWLSLTTRSTKRRKEAERR